MYRLSIAIAGWPTSFPGLSLLFRERTLVLGSGWYVALNIWEPKTGGGGMKSK